MICSKSHTLSIFYRSEKMHHTINKRHATDAIINSGKIKCFLDVCAFYFAESVSANPIDVAKAQITFG